MGIACRMVFGLAWKKCAGVSFSTGHLGPTCDCVRNMLHTRVVNSKLVYSRSKESECEMSFVGIDTMVRNVFALMANMQFLTWWGHCFREDLKVGYEKHKEAWRKWQKRP